MDPLQNQVNQNGQFPGNVPDDVSTYFPQATPNASPSDFFPPIPPAPSARQFGDKRIIATFLGMLLLVGGLGAGVIIVQNPQLINQKAAEIKPTPIPYCRLDAECSDTKILGSVGCIRASRDVTYCCPQNYKIFPEEQRCILK